MASINLYGEFGITVSVPAVGLVLILLCHRGRLWWVRRSIANATDAAEEDTEQGHTSGSDDDERYALATSKMRDWAVWLAIGWLFLAGMLTQWGPGGGHPAPLASRLHRIPTNFLLSLHGV